MVNELKMMDLNMTEKDIQSQCIKNELVKRFPVFTSTFFCNAIYMDSVQGYGELKSLEYKLVLRITQCT